MGTTRIKVIDLSSSEKEIKTSRKHAEKLAGLEKLKKEDKKPKAATEDLPSQATQNTDIPKLEENVEKAQDAKSPKPLDSKKNLTHQRGKKYQQAKQLIENKLYSKDEAFKLLPKTSTTKFDPTVEIHLNVNDKNIKGSLTFPHLKTIQKEKKYLIFTDKIFETKKQVIWANDKTITDIEKGLIKPGKDFDTVISSPKHMPSLTKIAKILGPKGLMPNPKNGTITDNIERLLDENINNNLYTYKCDPTAPIIHTKIGKLSQKEEELQENLKALVTAIGTAKIKNATLTTSMGPGIKLNLSSL